MDEKKPAAGSVGQEAAAPPLESRYFRKGLGLRTEVKDLILAPRVRDDARAAHNFDCTLPTSLREATRESQIIVTTTPSERALLFRDDVAPGTFVAAVGADNEHKQELDPGLLAAAAVVVDDLLQCVHGGDLHHALAALVMQPSDVRGSLDQVVAGTCRGRLSDDEIIVFDSTGVAIEDVAAAALVFERAIAGGAGVDITLDGADCRA